MIVHSEDCVPLHSNALASDASLHSHGYMALAEGVGSCMMHRELGIGMAQSWVPA